MVRQSKWSRIGNSDMLGCGLPDTTKTQTTTLAAVSNAHVHRFSGCNLNFIFIFNYYFYIIKIIFLDKVKNCLYIYIIFFIENQCLLSLYLLFLL